MRSATAFRIGVLAAFLLAVGAIAAPECCTWPCQARAQVSDGSAAKPQTEPPSSDARKEDRAAVRAAMESFVKAFESRDAKAIAAHWTAEGEFQTVEGTRVRGREAIEKGFNGFFAKTPEVKAEVHPEALRFLSSDTSIEEGTVTVRRGPIEAAINAHYSALFVRENGRWRLALLSESPGDKQSIGDLGWLVGEWKSANKQGAEIRASYSWHPNKKFLQAQFTIKEKDRTFSGTQVIGVDPTAGAIHSWTFEADGGIGEADWRRDGDHWVLDAEGTLSDGSTLTETNILRRVNDDTITWQSIDRMVGDAELADLPPVKVTRLNRGK